MTNSKGLQTSTINSTNVKFSRNVRRERKIAAKIRKNARIRKITTRKAMEKLKKLIICFVVLG